MSETAIQKYRLRRYYQTLSPLFKSPQAQAYTMAILSIATIAFFSMFAIKPTLVTITSLQKQITDKTTLNAQLEDKINALILAQQEYQKIEPILPTVYSLLPDKPNAPLLIRYLENLGIDNAVTLKQIGISPLVLFQAKSTTNATPSGQISKTQVNPIKIALSLTGEYGNITNFIDQLTKLDRLIQVASVNITTGDNSATNTNQAAKAELTISIDSQAFYFSSDL